MIQIFIKIDHIFLKKLHFQEIVNIEIVQYLLTKQNEINRNKKRKKQRKQKPLKYLNTRQ